MRLEEIVASVLGIPVDSVSDELKASDVESWDSLTHVQLVVSLEAAYGITFQAGEIERMYTSVQEIKDVLRGKGVQV